MNNKLMLEMVKDGWSIREIQDLIKESKTIEKGLALVKKYEHNHKITDFQGVDKYYCFKHKCYHKKYRNSNRNGKVIKVKTDSFIKCKQNAYQLSDSEVFKLRFKRSIENYSLDSHSKTKGSRKQ